MEMFLSHPNCSSRHLTKAAIFTGIFFPFVGVSVAELPRPICPFWAATCGRNLSGFGGVNRFHLLLFDFFRFTHRVDAPRHETLANLLAFIYQCTHARMRATLERLQNSMILKHETYLVVPLHMHGSVKWYFESTHKRLDINKGW